MIQILTNRLHGKSLWIEKLPTLINLLRGDIPEWDGALILTSLHPDGRHGAEKTQMVTCHLLVDLGPHMWAKKQIRLIIVKASFAFKFLLFPFLQGPRMLSGGKAGLVSIDILKKEQEENRRREKNNQPLEGWFSLFVFDFACFYQ